MQKEQLFPLQQNLLLNEQLKSDGFAQNGGVQQALIEQEAAAQIAGIFQNSMEMVLDSMGVSSATSKHDW